MYVRVRDKWLGIFMVTIGVQLGMLDMGLSLVSFTTSAYAVYMYWLFWYHYIVQEPEYQVHVIEKLEIQLQTTAHHCTSVPLNIFTLVRGILR